MELQPNKSYTEQLKSLKPNTKRKQILMHPSAKKKKKKDNYRYFQNETAMILNQIIVFDKVYKYLSNKNELDFNLIKKNSIDIKSDIFGLV